MLLSSLSQTNFSLYFVGNSLSLDFSYIFIICQCPLVLHSFLTSQHTHIALMFDRCRYLLVEGVDAEVEREAVHEARRARTQEYGCAQRVPTCARLEQLAAQPLVLDRPARPH